MVTRKQLVELRKLAQGQFDNIQKMEGLMRCPRRPGTARGVWNAACDIYRDAILASELANSIQVDVASRL